MTPQDVREKTFEKAVFGGYDMGAVDQFLEEVAGEWASLHKENAVLKSKLKVLVEKVEEYRATEDAMRMALLSAQKMSAEITEDARQKSETLIAEASEEAASILKNARQEAVNEESRLVEAKRSSALFLEKMRLICTKQLDFFDALGEMSFEEPRQPEPSEPSNATGHYGEYESGADYSEEYFVEDEEPGLSDTVRSIEDSVAKMTHEEAPDIDFDAGSGPDASFIPDEPTRPFDIVRDLGRKDPQQRPASNFNSLRFGESHENNG